MKIIALAMCHEGDFQRVEWKKEKNTHFELTTRGEKSVAQVAKALGNHPNFPLGLHPGDFHLYCDFGNDRSGDAKLAAELFSTQFLEREFVLPDGYVHDEKDISEVIRKIQFTESVRPKLLREPPLGNTLLVYFSPYSSLMRNFLKAFNLTVGPLLGFSTLNFEEVDDKIRLGQNSGLIIDFRVKGYTTIPAPTEESSLVSTVPGNK